MKTPVHAAFIYQITLDHSADHIKATYYLYHLPQSPENGLARDTLPSIPGVPLLKSVAGARRAAINTARYRTVKVEFRSIGKARWPFGWEILRQLSYPAGYWPGKERRAILEEEKAAAVA